MKKLKKNIVDEVGHPKTLSPVLFTDSLILGLFVVPSHEHVPIEFQTSAMKGKLHLFST